MVSQGRRNQWHERLIELDRQITPADECEDCGITMIEERVVVLTMDDEVGFCKALSWSRQPRREEADFAQLGYDHVEAYAILLSIAITKRNRGRGGYDNMNTRPRKCPQEFGTFTIGMSHLKMQTLCPLLIQNCRLIRIMYLRLTRLQAWSGLLGSTASHSPLRRRRAVTVGAN